MTVQANLEIGQGWRCLWPLDAILGEGPVWVPRDGALYFVDIKKPAIHWLVLATGERHSWTPPCRVGSIAPRDGEGFIAGTEDGLAMLDLKRGWFDLIVDPEPDRPWNRFNDGKLDRAGRFWAGTMDDSETRATGALYRVDPDLRWQKVDDGYRVTNGPAFSPDGRILYHSDSAAQLTYAFDLTGDGTPVNKRVFARYREEEGYPDGMTVDSEGCLWIAFWDAWCVRRLSPDGERLSEHQLPVQRPTSCAFGGERLDRLFVTSARVGLEGEALARQPLAGGLFELEVAATGLPPASFKG